MREIRTSGATRGEVALRVLPYSTVEKRYGMGYWQQFRSHSQQLCPLAGVSAETPGARQWSV